MRNPSCGADVYCCLILLDKKGRYVLWFSGEEDGVLSDGRTLFTWSSESELRRHAAANGWVVSDERPAVYDLDRVGSFVRGVAEIAPRDKLDVWNLLVDVAASVGALEFLAEQRRWQDTYDHVFYLSDLAPVKGTHPDPLTAAEDDRIRRIFAAGIDVLRQSVGSDS